MCVEPQPQNLKILKLYTLMELDAWQKDVLKWSREKDPIKRNLLICSPRQMGKSTIISEDAGEYALNNPKKVIMVIASVERQALLLFEKILSYIYLKDRKQIKTGKDRPTKHKLSLKNGSIIHCLPTGDSGFGIRGYTIDRLYADEAAFIPEEVWAAVTPMLATTGGSIILLSTPFGTDNYFYRMSTNEKFKFIHVDPEEVIAGRPKDQGKRMIEFRKDEKERMTKLQYQQEHMGFFVGGIQKFFPDDLIDQICTLPLPSKEVGSFAPFQSGGDNFQGIDIARMGGDETVLVSVQRKDRKSLKQIDIEIPEGAMLTATARMIIHRDKLINHKKIYIDDGGLGVGVYDILLDDKQTKRKVISINNASRSLEERDGRPRRKPLLKEDLYNNLKNLMENGKIKLYDDPRIRQSLRSIQYENTEGYLKIYGNYSHITEALIRAAWCMKDKSLNILAFC